MPQHIKSHLTNEHVHELKREHNLQKMAFQLNSELLPTKNTPLIAMDRTKFKSQG